jgi:hypothetical protein
VLWEMQRRFIGMGATLEALPVAGGAVEITIPARDQLTLRLTTNMKGIR